MTQKPVFPPLTLWIMTIATGLSVANLYYCQPLLHQMQTSFHVDDSQIGWIPTLTQAGYAAGMLLIVPLGDMFERRKMIVIFSALSAIAMGAAAFSSSLFFASLMSFLVGITTMAPQILIPMGATLALPERRGQVVGTLVSGLLMGILLARTIAGFVGAAFGWRVMFGLAAGMLLVLAIALQFLLPKSEPFFKGSYSDLLKSVLDLVKTQKVLRECMIFGGMLFAAFSAFWATLIHLMESDSFHLGARTVGLFGLLGAAGALAAPLIGKLADKRDPRGTTGIGIFLTALSFFIYWIWGGHSLIALAIGVLIMDVGIQSAHVTNQSRVFSLIPEARSRLNTAYMFAYFFGGALGSSTASYAWKIKRWPGVCGTALFFLTIAVITYFLPLIKQNKKKA